MPRKPKSSKNSRRIQSAESALAATQRNRQPRTRVSRPSKTTRRPRGRGLAQPQAGLPRDAEEYALSIRKDILCANVRLPTMSISSPYTRLRLSTRYTPIGDANGGFSLLVNPCLAFSDYYQYVVGTGASTATQSVPSVMANGSMNTGFPSGTSGFYTAVSLANQLTSPTTYGFYGQVRCLGVMYRIDYTGPNSTKGGELLIFHNGRNAPALYQSTNGAQPWLTGYTTPAAMATAESQFSVHYMGTSFRHVWRPIHLDFVDYSTYRSRDLTSTTTEYNVFASPELAMPTSNTCTPTGWTSGFYCKPAATVTAGSSAPYVVTLEVIVDVTAFHGQSNVPVLASTDRAIADPPTAAKINNSLAELHHARATNVADLHTGDTGLSAFASHAVQGVEDVAKQFTADMLTRAMASAFGGA